MNERPPESSTRPADEHSDRLDSWKDVAAYLKRDVRYGPALGTARGLAGSSASPRQARFGVRVSLRARCLVAQPEIAERGDKRSRRRNGSDHPVVREPGERRSIEGRHLGRLATSCRIRKAALAPVGDHCRAGHFWCHRDRVRAVPEPCASAPGPEIKSLVVLPLDNLSGDPTKSFLQQA